MVFAIIGNSIQNIALGQSNSNDTSGNQTTAEITGEQQSSIVNKTTIPAQQTTVTVNETITPIDQAALQPLENQTLGGSEIDLSNIENRTVVQPIGEAQTTILNKTTVPFEQTTVEGTNQTQGQGQQQGSQGQQQGSQGQQQGTNQTQGQGQQQGGQGNQSSGPLEQLGEAIKAPFQ